MEKLEVGDCPPFDPSAFSKFPFQNIQVYKSEDWNFLFQAKQFQSKIKPLLDQWIKEEKDRANREIAELVLEKTSEGFQKLAPILSNLAENNKVLAETQKQLLQLQALKPPPLPSSPKLLALKL
jgi:ATP-dependent helicase/DNAse subunit B